MPSSAAASVLVGGQSLDDRPHLGGDAPERHPLRRDLDLIQPLDATDRA
jgi:hypothetical protein